MLSTVWIVELLQDAILDTELNCVASNSKQDLVS